MKYSITELRKQLFTAVVADALDQLGLRHQSPRADLFALTPQSSFLLGGCKTTLWADMAHVDPRPYELELKAVDECIPDDCIQCGYKRFDAVWYLGRFVNHRRSDSRRE